MTAILWSLVAVATASCAHSKASCFWEFPKTDEAYARCEDRKEDEKRNAKAERQAKREEERRQQQRREAYKAARAPCERGDAKACMTVAAYAIEHRHDAAEIDRALQTACKADLVEACVTHATHQTTPAAALPSYQRACTLGHAKACFAIGDIDPSQRIALDARACELKLAEACERLGFAYLDGRQVAADRARAEMYLKLACRGARDAACTRLGELAVEPSP